MFIKAYLLVTAVSSRLFGTVTHFLYGDVEFTVLKTTDSSVAFLVHFLLLELNITR